MKRVLLALSIVALLAPAAWAQDTKTSAKAASAPSKTVETTGQSDAATTRRILKTPLTDLDLSVKAFDALKQANVTTLEGLVSLSQDELVAIVGKKSLSELEELVADKGLSFGMDVSKYNLEED